MCHEEERFWSAQVYKSYGPWNIENLQILSCLGYNFYIWMDFFHNYPLATMLRRGYSIASVCVCVCVWNLVNKIQSILLNLESSNLPQMFAMERGWTLLIFKVRGQRSRSHWTILEKPCEQDRKHTTQPTIIKPSTNVHHGEMMNPIDFQGQRSKVKVTLDNTWKTLWTL